MDHLMGNSLLSRYHFRTYRFGVENNYTLSSKSVRKESKERFSLVRSREKYASNMT